MPLTKYTGANLKKMKKDDLISHILDLYQFTDLFNNEALYKKQVIKLEEENKKMKDMLLKFKKECDEVKDEVKQLEGEKLELQLNKDKAVEYLEKIVIAKNNVIYADDKEELKVVNKELYDSRIFYCNEVKDE
tara:strand:- start:190 stop:588 length:399 start_codon:yes stop_codon:yes gene_type:complete